MHGIIIPNVFTTDDDALAAQNDVRHEKLGTIEVKMRRTLPGYAPPIGPAHYSHQDSGPVHERSKKAGAHRVGYATQPEQTFTPY